MTIQEILSQEGKTNKQITEELANSISTGTTEINVIINELIKQTGSKKATIIEALEYATKEKQGILNRECFKLIVEAMENKEPRTKWEAARVIANVANEFVDDMDTAIKGLEKNINDGGTVVRWSIATALSTIMLSDYKDKGKLFKVLKQNEEKEEKNSIKKIYVKAIKKYLGK